MTIAETYLGLFAALGTADKLFLAWISVSLIASAPILFFNDRLNRAMGNWLLILYLLFSLVVADRWGVVLTKVIDLLGTLREQDESFPFPQISLLLGLASIAILFIGSVVTARLVLVRHGKVRVI
tara:strand:+ start:77 stop:451 length:375 start_codon:yes stop_codon:yes gene_type:complete